MQNLIKVSQNRYAILELNRDRALVTDSMSFMEIQEFVKKKYSDQPLSYFNSSHNLWLIDVTNRTIRPLSIKLEL